MKLGDIDPAYLRKHGIEVSRSRASKYGNRQTEYGGRLFALAARVLLPLR